jgi:hypothetical protein
MWDSALRAAVAPRANHEVLFDNESLRVLEALSLGTGEAEPSSSMAIAGSGARADSRYDARWVTAPAQSGCDQSLGSMGRTVMLGR